MMMAQLEVKPEFLGSTVTLFGSCTHDVARDILLTEKTPQADLRLLAEQKIEVVQQKSST